MWNRAENQVEFYFIRHGYTSSNLAGKYLGKTDEELSKAGITELKNNLASKYDFVNQGHVRFFFGPMKRCRQTAQALNNDVIWETVEEFTEIDFGDFEGLSYKELSGNDNYQKWIDSNGEIPFPNGEAKDNFIERSMKGFTKIKNLITENEKVCCVLHGGNIMAILSSITKEEYYSFQVKPGRGYHCLIDIDKLELIEIEEI